MPEGNINSIVCNKFDNIYSYELFYEKVDDIRQEIYGLLQRICISYFIVRESDLIYCFVRVSSIKCDLDFLVRKTRNTGFIPRIIRVDFNLNLLSKIAKLKENNKSKYISNFDVEEIIKCSNYKEFTLLLLSFISKGLITFSEAYRYNCLIYVYYHRLNNHELVECKNEIKLFYEDDVNRKYIWIHCRSNVKKYLLMHKIMDKMYIKNQFELEWDNYKGEKTVIIDDWVITNKNLQLYSNGSKMIHELYIYLQNKLFYVYNNGKKEIPLFDKLIIISRYSLETCFRKLEFVYDWFKSHFLIVDLVNNEIDFYNNILFNKKYGN